jgi:hypothetical protein
MMQVPAAMNVAVEAEAETVQMVGEVEVKVTGRPELAVAVSATATDGLAYWVGIAPNVIVWTARLTVKLCVTSGAAA